MRILLFFPLILLSACSPLRLNPHIQTKIYQQPVDFYVDEKSVAEQINKKNRQTNYFQLKRQLTQKGLITLNQQLSWLQKHYSLDFATFYLINAIYAKKGNLAINREYQKNIHWLQQNKSLPKQAYDYYFLFIPGWLYQSMPETGADFAIIRNKFIEFGLQNELLASRENASIEENALIIKKRIEQLADKKIILISVSKSGSEVATLINDAFLQKHPQLKGWINISGLLKGTPLANIADEFPLNITMKSIFSFYDLDTRVITELRHHQQKSYFTHYQPKADFTIFNIVAIPFFDQLSFSAFAGYQFLYEYGPNDGRALIVDQLAPGNTLVEIGLDHYFKDKNMPLKSLAILMTIVNAIEKNKKAIQASNP